MSAFHRRAPRNHAAQAWIAGPAATIAFPAYADQLETSLAQLTLTTLAALALLGALAYGSVWLLRRLAPGRWNSPGIFRLRATYALGARERVVLLEAAGRLLVLGVTAQRIDLLLELPHFDSTPDKTTARTPEAQTTLVRAAEK
jgi:flagellar protein FliO/FliZ